jgi:hypothetical protein
MPFLLRKWRRWYNISLIQGFRLRRLMSRRAIIPTQIPEAPFVLICAETRAKIKGKDKGGQSVLVHAYLWVIESWHTLSWVDLGARLKWLLKTPVGACGEMLRQAQHDNSLGNTIAPRVSFRAESRNLEFFNSHFRCDPFPL